MKQKRFQTPYGFTLIELLTVIAIIAVLMGLLFPAVGSVKDAARKAQAKNDCVQIATAINAFYTEYGKYPIPGTTAAADWDAADDANNNVLFDILRAEAGNGNATTNNPRMISFIQPPISKDLTKPKAGIGGNGRFYDPWGRCYRIRIDGSYDNAVANPYTQNAGFSPIGTGVIVWSLGKDGAGGSGDKIAGTASDDVLSWQ